MGMFVVVVIWFHHDFQWIENRLISMDFSMIQEKSTKISIFYNFFYCFIWVLK